MKRYFPFLLYAVLILIVFWGVLLPPEGKILFGPDITRYHYWQRQLLGSALREGQIPWWNPYTMMGVPYLEHPQIPVWYLPNILFVLLPTNVAISWYIGLHLLIAMAGMYMLVRGLVESKQQTANNKQFFAICSLFSVICYPFSLSAWASGVAFGLSAYFVSRIPAGHIDIIAASSWTGWVVAAFAQLLRAQVGMPLISRRQGPDRSIIHHGFFAKAMTTLETTRLPARLIALAGIGLAIQLLAGHPMVAVFTLEAVFIVSSFRSYFEKSWKPMMGAGIAVLLGAGIAAIQLLPNAQYIAHSIRTLSFPESWAQLGTPTIWHLLEFLDPFYFYSRLPDSGFGFEHVGYMGKTTMLFALVAIIGWIISKKHRRVEIPIFFIIGVFGIWMWLGNNAPVDLFSWVRSWLPLYAQIRIPARHIVLFVLSVSVLFGMGLALIKSKIIQFFVVVLVLVELIPFARHHLSLVSIPERIEDSELVTFLTNDESLYRFLPNFYHGDPLREVLEFNAPITHKIQSISGYDTPPIRHMYEFLLAVNGYRFADILSYSESIPPFRAMSSPYLNFLNVKYILVSTVEDSMKGIQSGQFALVKENISRGWRLYENKNVSPRFFIATKMQMEPNREAVLAAIGKASLPARQGSVNPKTTIIVDGSTVDTSGFRLDCPAGYQGSASVSSYGYGRIVLTSNNPCNAILATSEVMYPGWTSAVDGKSVPVFEGNAAFRTIYLPKGTHQIVFSYRPMIVLWGALISIVTIGIIILFMFK